MEKVIGIPPLSDVAITNCTQRLADQPLGEDAPGLVVSETTQDPCSKALDVQPTVPHNLDVQPTVPHNYEPTSQLCSKPRSSQAVA